METALTQLARQLLQAPAQARTLRTRLAARLMTQLEDDPARLPEVFSVVAEARGSLATLQPLIVIGVTGAPGSGKSTLVDALVSAIRRRRPGEHVGVIAVDPSSPFSGGAVLGDRVRMMRHANDAMVFVRSLASRGRLGGLSAGVQGVIHAMALAGFETVIVETVGVGQSEMEVARVADVTVVVLAPGQGDSVQLLKAGLLEAADVIAVNKADREGASTLYAEILASLRSPRTHDAAASPATAIDVCLVSATDRTGVEALMDALDVRRERDQEAWLMRRQRESESAVREMLLEAGRARLAARVGRASVDDAVRRLLSGRATVDQLADELMGGVCGRGSL